MVLKFFQVIAQQTGMVLVILLFQANSHLLQYYNNLLLWFPYLKSVQWPLTILMRYQRWATTEWKTILNYRANKYNYYYLKQGYENVWGFKYVPLRDNPMLATFQVKHIWKGKKYKKQPLIFSQCQKWAELPFLHFSVALYLSVTRIASVELISHIHASE